MLGWQRHIYDRLSPNEPLLEFEVKRVTIALSLFSLLSSTLASCTAASQNAQNSTQPSNSELSSVAVAVRDLGNPFFVQVGKGAEAEAKKLGGANVRTTLVSSGDDLNQQFNQIENFIASNVGMIVLNAADTKGIAPAVEKAKQAGIPIIAVDTAAEGGVDATVTSIDIHPDLKVRGFPIITNWVSASKHQPSEIYSLGVLQLLHRLIRQALPPKCYLLHSHRGHG
jgi:ribose transport system substrate-binding protein